MDSSYSALILAGGACSRFGRPDMLREKVGGKSVLSHSLDLFAADENCIEILICASPTVAEWVAGDPLTFSIAKMRLLNAEASRAASAATAVKTAKAGFVVLHNANRPNFKPELLAQLLVSTRPGCGAVPALEIPGIVADRDELETGDAANSGSFLGPKKEHRIGRLGRLVALPPLCEIQTPQCYRRDDYVAALESTGDLDSPACDSQLLAAAGQPPALISGRRENFPIVLESDLRLLLKLMGSSTPKKKDKYGGLGW